MPLDLHQCDKACFGCIKRYKCKYTLATGSKFEIQCKGIALYEQLNLFDGMPASERQAAIGILDPVRWAADMLDWHCLDPDGAIWKRKNPSEYENWLASHPDTDISGKSRYHRPYQAEMLRCQKGDTKVFMADGTVKQIKDIQIGDKVITYNEGKKQIQSSYKVLNVWQNGEKDLYKVSLQNGDVLYVTDNHPILAWSKCGKQNILLDCLSFKRSYRSISDGLTIGDKVYTLNTFNKYGSINDINLAKLLGYIVTDGYIQNTGEIGKKHVLQFVNIRKEYVDEFANLLKLVFNVQTVPIKCIPERIDKNNVHHQQYWEISIYGIDSPVLTFLRSIGCLNKTNREISILNYAFQFSQQSLALFINRCWSGDGSVYNYGAITSLRLASGNKEFLELYRLLLKKIGIYASHIYKDKKEGKGISLDIRRVEDISQFFLICGKIFGKEIQSDTAITSLQSRNLFHRHGKLSTMSRTKIVDIEFVGKELVYDIEVETRHNFIANGIVVHNCSARQKVFRLGRQAGKSEAIVVSMLFHLFTKPGLPENEGFKIVILTPYQAQIDLLFKRMEELLSTNPNMSNSIQRNVKSPIYTITLHNKSEIKGFTAGTKSGGDANAIRGQHANMLVFDEADYLAAKDIESALSIITNHPDASVWMSSTPCGKREQFYTKCYARDWKEFYYPSQSNPLFDDRMDKLFRDSMSEIAYKHEVLAEFGEQEEGVFQNSYVQAAKANYRYGEIPHNRSWVYTMGVDWNDTKIGTTIIVLGFDPSRNIFSVVDSQVVSRDGWTQLSACQKIAELNRLWKPIVIYIDSGFGGTQWEVLRKYGYDSTVDPAKGPGHSDSRLKDIVKRYDFGSKIEVHDLWTHAPIQKPAKPFLVESATRRFETQDIRFSQYDEALEKQLLGYVIDRVTPTGVPVYKASNEITGDHTLDALMLAIVGFVLEVTPLGKPRFQVNIGFAGYFGEHNEPEIGQGDTVITIPKKQDPDRSRLRPSVSRTATLQPTTLLGVNPQTPAAHMQGPRQLGLWAFPGFDRDDPRPKIRSLSEAEADARKRTGFLVPRFGGKPRRKNI